jgi:hypothetical protein
MKRFFGIQIDFYGAISVQEVEADCWEDARWRIERSDCTTFVLDEKEAKLVCRTLSQLLGQEKQEASERDRGEKWKSG